MTPGMKSGYSGMRQTLTRSQHLPENNFKINKTFIVIFSLNNIIKYIPNIIIYAKSLYGIYLIMTTDIFML